MSHHGNEDAPGKRFMTFTNRESLMRNLLDASGFKGALGSFPEGKLTDEDEGAIQFAVGSEGDKVILDFGTSVKWVGMSAEQAAELASILLRRAREVGRRQGRTVTFTF